MSGGEEYVQVPRSYLDALTDLLGSGHAHDEQVREQGRREGQDAATHGYSTGWALGHDTGSSARQDTRQYVHGILDGWAAGCDERQELVKDLLRRSAPRRPERERQADPEAGA